MKVRFIFGINGKVEEEISSTIRFELFSKHINLFIEMCGESGWFWYDFTNVLQF